MQASPRSAVVAAAVGRLAHDGLNRLIALAGVSAGRFLAVVRTAWAEGDAIFPIDPRLPAPAVAALLALIRPAVVRSDDGDVALDGAVPVCPGDAIVVATSGTTGQPKGAILTYAALVSSAYACHSALGVDSTRDHWLACLPLAHIGGLSIVTRSIVAGVPCTVHDVFDPVAVDAAYANGATLTSLVPAALARVDARRWRRILLGGSALPGMLPPNCVRTYGMTETASGVVYDGVALAGVELRADPSGQLHVRGPMLLRAYRTTTPDGHDPRTPDGWFATGDAGAVAADGTVTVHGRVGDVIVSGGEKVWPDPVERVLATVDGVAEVAIAGRADPVWGTRVVAYVVPRDPLDPPSLPALRDAVKAVLAAYCAPHELVLRTALPRTSIGKVIRSQLDDQ